MPDLKAWKADNYKFYGKAFDYAYANKMKQFMPIIGTAQDDHSTYELEGVGGYGEMLPYDGTSLNHADQKRGFKTVLRPQEYTNTAQIGFLQAKTDKLGECRKVGTRLGQGAAMTVMLHIMRMFSNAFDPNCVGGDGKPWAATDHPVASLGGKARKNIPDPESGTFSNIINKTLNVDGIDEAVTMAQHFVTPDGLPFLCNMDCVLVSPDLEITAKKLFGENANLMPRLNPADNTNAANPIYGMTYLVMGGGRDGFGKKQWAICDREIMKEVVKLYYIQKPTIFSTDTDNPMIDLVTAYAAFACGWGDARQIIFSNPS